MRIDLGALSEQPLRQMKCDQLRFHLAGSKRNALTLYQWLARHLNKLDLHIGQHRFALPPSVAFVGFEANEALLPSPGEQMDGYRILHEFFCFPERFHGFRIDGLGSYWPDEAAVHIQLEFGFSAPLPPDIQIDQTTILLNCIPAINLFSCTAEPIPLNGQALCETVRMGRQGGKKGEIFSIDRVSSQRQKSSDHVQDFKPFEALDRDFPLAEPTPARYYKLDIEQEPVNDKVQHRISLVHHNLAPYLGLHEELNIDLTCSNGPLAQQLRVVEPQLARAGLQSDWRIFQHRPVPQLLEELFRERRWGALTQHLVNPHQTREFCVQAGDLDLNFFWRLSAEEGLISVFEHSQGSHGVIQADQISQFGSLEGDPVLYVANRGGTARQPCLHDFRYREQVRTSIQVQRDYTFTHPRYNLEHTLYPRDMGNQGNEYERYDYPGRYKHDNAGKPFTQSRVNALFGDARVAQVKGDDARLQPGIAFQLAGHAREDLNILWRPMQITHKGQQFTALEPHQRTAAMNKSSFCWRAP
ncbi:type VI secretion system tip protein VgrG [Pseudomonas asiatica]|uniref:type VI secretion system tip protein VgrG n=1 Tax=Pseudomonas asiatica TaxID=2219225 RepID=UPI0020166FDD|nr:type VI secretion system tip protein VgrG [Pseudomonas asiatica]